MRTYESSRLLAVPKTIFNLRETLKLLYITAYKFQTKDNPLPFCYYIAQFEMWHTTIRSLSTEPKRQTYSSTFIWFEFEFELDREFLVWDEMFFVWFWH